MKAKPPFSSTYIYLLLALMGYVTADLTILSFRDQMIPSKGPPASRARITSMGQVDSGKMTMITSKNIFNSDGKIPDALGADQNAKPADDIPTLSNLPLALVGTLVHADPDRSIATINLKNKNDNQSFAVDDEIEGMAKIVKVERNKVVFRNTSTGRLEYIEIKQDQKLNFGMSKSKVDGPVTIISDTDREILRKDVDEITSNLPQVLQQARAIPNFKGNAVDGFKIVDLQKGSIYDKLGIKPGDIIKGVNGEPIDSASKALELYNALKTSSSINIEVERDGHSEQLNYTIK